MAPDSNTRECEQGSSDDQYEKWFNAIDLDGDGVVTLNECFGMIYRRCTPHQLWMWRAWILHKRLSRNDVVLGRGHTFVDRGRWEGTRRSTTGTHLEVHFYFWCSLLWHTPLFVSTVHTGRKKLQAKHQTYICKCVLRHHQKNSSTRSTLATEDSIFCRKKDLTWSDVMSCISLYCQGWNWVFRVWSPSEISEGSFFFGKKTV